MCPLLYTPCYFFYNIATCLCIVMLTKLYIQYSCILRRKGRCNKSVQSSWLFMWVHIRSSYLIVSHYHQKQYCRSGYFFIIHVVRIMARLMKSYWGYRMWSIRISSSWGLTWRPARGHPARKLTQGMAGWPWRSTRPVVTCSGLKYLIMYHCFNAMSCSGVVYVVITFICMLHQHINMFL